MAAVGGLGTSVDVHLVQREVVTSMKVYPKPYKQVVEVEVLQLVGEASSL